MIKNLVFSAGGTRCISYISILNYIENNTELFNIQNISASSGGSIYALCFCLGYTFKDMKELSMNMTPERICDLRLTDFFENYGLDSGKKIEQFIKLIIKKKQNNEDINFKQFYEKYKINLIITGTNLKTRNTEYFSYKTYPDMPLFIAVKISCAVPFYYKYVTYNNQDYVDGGLLDFYPISQFEDEIDDTLGFLIEANHYDKTYKNNFGLFILNFIDCLTSNLNEKYKKYEHRTIFLKCQSMNNDNEILSGLEFNLSRKVIVQIIDNSYEIICKSMDNYILKDNEEN